MSESITCTVSHIIYSNPENGYAVLRSVLKNGATATITGTFGSVCVGTVLDCSGQWVDTKKFGRQFQSESYSESMPVSTAGIKAYLGSGMFKGIGRKYAELIVATFGDKAIEVIDNEPDRLSEVPGMGKKRIAKIKESWEKHRHMKNVMLFLQDNGVSVNLAKRIFDKYGDKSVQVVKDNPYILADELFGVGFKKADDIAMKMGYDTNDPRRIAAGILFVMNSHIKDGHVFSDYNKLIAESAEILGVMAADVGLGIYDLTQNDKAIREGDAVYLPTMYHSENGIAKKLRSLLVCDQGRIEFNLFDIENISKATGVEYDEIQAQAITTAASAKVLVLTGGPGTGKTTTLKGIIEMFRTRNMSMILAAPTGRAAKRMSEATGMNAKTIHRLLEYTPQGGFQRNAKSPLKGDVLIVDECSMIDVVLMNALLRALPKTMRVVLVGDVDQLPSVGAGNVLRDIIDSGYFPVVRLERIFRQAQTSMIVMNAHAINKGMLPRIDNRNSRDFFFMECEEADRIPDIITGLVQQRLPSFYGLRHSDIQVLSPMRRGAAGTDNLNQRLQSALNPQGAQLNYGSTVFRNGDRVMQIRNNYDKDVFNGDVGYIVNVDEEDSTLTVDFDGNKVEYETSDLCELTLAYASTIHKSQGSEYPIVIIPVHTTHYIMLQRNLIYTGITRAKQVCVLVGTKKALAMAVRNQAVLSRNTKLIERINA